MLPTGATLLVFAAASLGILVLPGPSVVYVVTRGVEQGPAAGLLAMLGLETGALLHAVGASAGLATVLASSSTAFATVRYAGAAYLLCLAYTQLRGAREAARDEGGHRRSSRWRLYRDGVLVDLLNPKTSLFFLAFLPQFVDDSHGSAGARMLVLGSCFVLLAALCDSTYAVLGGWLGKRARSSPRLRTHVGWASGLVYVTLAGVAVAG